VIEPADFEMRKPSWNSRDPFGIQFNRTSGGIVGLTLSAVLILVLGGCSKSDGDSGKITTTTPKEAASQLERAFANSNPDAKKNADIVSEALRKGDYEKAVVSLQAIRSGSNITLEQGVAIHGSVVALEGKLVTAMESGDENAKKAYELLKQFKRH
jgi:hypothetical protein